MKKVLIICKRYFLLFPDQNKSLILTLAFDVETQTLFWSDILQEVIMKMHILPDGSLEEAKVFHNLTSLNPCGIALDVCNRCAILSYIDITIIIHTGNFDQFKNSI